MRRSAIAIVAAGIAVGAAAYSSSVTHHGSGTWTIASCRVDVTYIDDTNPMHYYVPDTDANFQRHYADNNVSGAAGLAVVITLVNTTGRVASLPTGLVVSFADRSGKYVGNRQTVNNRNGTGYGGAIAHGHGSGEAFSASTLFSPGQSVAESPDIASVPARPGLRCHVSPR